MHARFTLIEAGLVAVLCLFAIGSARSSGRDPEKEYRIVTQGPAAMQIIVATD